MASCSVMSHSTNVLERIEGEILGSRYIEELLAMVAQGTSNNIGRLAADRDRLRGEIQKLVGSIAMGQEQPASMVEAIRERELEVNRNGRCPTSSRLTLW
ncbi:MAG: hypothetical protein ACM3SQ_07210 [Betaproteobacteria bacterium]